MTFSDKTIVNFVKQHFVPVWESVVPTRVTTFDLGGGKTVTGINNGEIALYVCRPDGKVIDILPGLRSPQETLDFLRAAKAALERTGGDEAAVRATHRRLLKATGGARPLPSVLPVQPAERRDATDEIRNMAKKSILVTPTERVMVVQPKRVGALRAAIHASLSGADLKTPDGWKVYVFETIMSEPLKGGSRRFAPASLTVR